MNRLIEFIKLLMLGKLPCAFNALTGYYCPGCGGTRSVRALLSGHLLQSFFLHPIPVYVIIAVTFNLLLKIIKKDNYRFSPIWLWTALAVVIINVVIKNIMLLIGVDLLNIF